MSVFLQKTWLICRVCLKHHWVMRSIFDNGDNTLKDIYLKLRDCGGIPVRKNDKLPDRICEKCFQSLIQAHTFRLSCQRAHSELMFRTREADELQLENDYTLGEEYNADGGGDSVAVQISVREPNEIEIDLTSNADDQDLYESQRSTYKNFETLESDCARADEIYNSDSQVRTSSGKWNSMEFNMPKTCTTKGKKIKTASKTSLYCLKLRSGKTQTLPKKSVQISETNIQKTLPLPKEATEHSVNLKSNSEYKITPIFELQSDEAGLKDKSTNIQKSRKKVAIKIEKISIFICKDCKKGFSSSVLLKHHSNIHKKPHVCSKCGKRFSQSQSLKFHLNVHEGAKPYNCRFCTKTFANATNRNRHEKLVHKDQCNEIKCEKCSKNFRQIEMLEKHVSSKKCIS